MNILSVSTSDGRGGASKVNQELRDIFREQGHTVPLFVADKHTQDPDTHIIPRPKWRKWLGILFATDRFITTDWLLNTSEFKAADVVHCHNLHGRFFNLKTLARMSKIKPVIWTLHDEWAITTHGALTMHSNTMKYGFFECPSLRVPPRMVWDNRRNYSVYKTTAYNNMQATLACPSQWLMQRTLKTVLAKQDVMHIPNGIDTAVFVQSDKVTARTELSIPKDTFVVLFVANDSAHSPWKGWDQAQEVISKFSDMKNVLFINIGNEEHEHRDNVLYIPFVESEAQLAKYYSAADAFLLTSLSENFPLVILEAMACGLPCISFDVGGVSEAIQHRTHGYISPYGDTQGLCEGLQWVMSLSEEEHTALSNAARSRAVAHYDTRTMAQRYLDVYTECITNFKPQ